MDLPEFWWVIVVVAVLFGFVGFVYIVGVLMRRAKQEEQERGGTPPATAYQMRVNGRGLVVNLPVIGRGPHGHWFARPPSMMQPPQGSCPLTPMLVKPGAQAFV